MRIGEGTIEEIKEDGLAKIKVSRDFLYVACSACAGAEHVMITAYNGLGAQEGNRVRYEVDDSHLAMSSFICFMMPLLLAAAGALAGYGLGAETMWGTAGAVIGLACGVAGVKYYDNRLGKMIDTKASITAILDDEEDNESSIA